MHETKHRSELHVANQSVTDDSDDDEYDVDFTDETSLVNILGDRDRTIPHTPIPESFSWKRLFVFMGPGFLVSTSFVDPGNFDTDIQSGARFEYELVWVLVSATMLGLFLQNLAAKLGVVTGQNLAEICAIEYAGKLKYVLWAIAEVAIIASDIPEVIGTAFALKFLFDCPLWFGVLITSVSVMVFLMVNLFGDRKLETLIASMIGIVVVCFLGEVLMSSVKPIKLLAGFIPTFNYAAIYAATSLIGSVVMPHNIFLHSALVQTRPIRRTLPGLREACFYNFLESGIALSISLVINVSILAMAAAEFFPNDDAGLLSAPFLLQKILKGRAAPRLFAIALLASGQSSTMTGTYAGQFVMEGFLKLRMAKWARAVLTRSMAILPSLVIALMAGDKGADQLIILSQVILSVLLPFSLIPLVKITSCPDKMGVFVNSYMTKVTIAVLGSGVTFANVMLIGAEIVPSLSILTGFVSALATILVVTSAIAYLALLAYLLITPVSHHSSLDIKPS